jgi:paraquat-inducible protein A
VVARREGSGMSVTAAQAGMTGCNVCGLLNRRPATSALSSRCARCGSTLRARKPDSIARTWALLIAAYVLYAPANLMPVLATGSIGKGTSDTILGGAARLWSDGAWPLALVIIVASFGVPLVKLFALTWLLLAAQGLGHGSARTLTRLYRVVDSIGRWSMVDIYVCGLLVALVQFQPFATVTPGPGAAAFGAVVVLTILAARSFDPRLLWDAEPGARWVVRYG